MLYRGLKSLDELDALKEREKLRAPITDTQPLILGPLPSALIDYSNYPLDLSLVSALVAFDPADLY